MSLNSVATPIWNEIARTQELKTAWGRKAFNLNAAQMVELVNREYEELKADRVSTEVCKAYLDLKPLLLENVAISRHIQQTDNQSLRQALPEVTTVNEAVILASVDQELSTFQQRRLAKLLQSALH